MKSSSKWKNKILRRGRSSWWSKIRRGRRKSGIARSSEMGLKGFTEVLTWINSRSLETLGGMPRARLWLFIKKSTQMDPLSLLGRQAEELLRVSIKTMGPTRIRAKTSIKIGRVWEWWRGWVAWITQLRPSMVLQEGSTQGTPSTQTDLGYSQAWREPQQSWTRRLSTSKGRTR